MNIIDLETFRKPDKNYLDNNNQKYAFLFNPSICHIHKNLYMICVRGVARTNIKEIPIFSIIENSEIEDILNEHHIFGNSHGSHFENTYCIAPDGKPFVLTEFDGGKSQLARFGIEISNLI